VILFFIVILIGGMGLAMIHHYLFLYLDSLGADTIIMGLALTIATISELFIMYFSDRLLRSWKTRGLIMFGLLMITIRLFGYSLARSPEFALVLQLFHGPTFAAIWMAGVAYVAEIAPPGLGNTAQGMFTGVVMGLGSAFGALFGGLLFQSVGFSIMFTTAGSVVFVAFILFWIGCRKRC
jgi:predicted MFS family arabinose efflux permease